MMKRIGRRKATHANYERCYDPTRKLKRGTDEKKKGKIVLKRRKRIKQNKMKQNDR